MKKQEQIEVRECLLSFCAESFVLVQRLATGWTVWGSNADPRGRAV
jgi:hypothetical protein